MSLLSFVNCCCNVMYLSTTLQTRASSMSFGRITKGWMNPSQPWTERWTWRRATPPGTSCACPSWAEGRSSAWCRWSTSWAEVPSPKPTRTTSRCSPSSVPWPYTVQTWVPSLGLCFLCPCIRTKLSARSNNVLDTVNLPQLSDKTKNMCESISPFQS